MATMKKHERGWLKHKIVVILQFLLNPRFLLCFCMAWMITNGWSYVFFALGLLLDIPWMTAVGGAYLAFLWLPISPEKIVTIAISIQLLRWFFPNDQKTLKILKDMYAKLKHQTKVLHRAHKIHKAGKKIAAESSMEDVDTIEPKENEKN